MCFVVVGLTNHKEKRAHMICLTKCNQTTQTDTESHSDQNHFLFSTQAYVCKLSVCHFLPRALKVTFRQYTKSQKYVNNTHCRKHPE